MSLHVHASVKDTGHTDRQETCTAPARRVQLRLTNHCHTRVQAIVRARQQGATDCLQTVFAATGDTLDAPERCNYVGQQRRHAALPTHRAGDKHSMKPAGCT
jgi:hypothetical protein